MSIETAGATMVELRKASMPSMVVTAAYAGNDAALTGSVEAFSTGVERARVVTDQGLIDGADGNVRYVLADEPAGWRAPTGGGNVAINGQVLALTFADGSQQRVRVRTRRAMAGAVRLGVDAEFAEG
jgi:hypothetical protein